MTLSVARICLVGADHGASSSDLWLDGRISNMTAEWHNYPKLEASSALEPYQALCRDVPKEDINLLPS